MQVNQAYRWRSGPEDNGDWGNDLVENMLKRFPWLTLLVQALRTENRCFGSHQRGHEWSALFFEDNMTGRPSIISLELMPSRRTLVVPSLPLDEGRPPTIEDVKSWVITNIRRQSR